MVKEKDPIICGQQFDCTECKFKEHPIIIVGPTQFCSDLLTNYIRLNKPALTSMVRRLGDVPHPFGLPPVEWRLIFVDCLRMNNEAIMKMLQTEAAPYLQHDILALFNLPEDSADITGFIDRGVRGFFFENEQPDVMLKGICALKFGEMWASRGVLMEYVSHKSKPAAPQDQATRLLTRREKEILVHLSTCATNKEIASRLKISLHTVKSHIFNICKKIKVGNRLQAAMWAAKNLK